MEYRRVGTGEAERCAALAERAFRGDPFFRAAGGSEEGFRLLLGLLVRAWLESQTAFAAVEGGRSVGLALVGSPDTAAISVRDCVKLGAGRVVRACGLGRMLDFLGASACFDRAFDRIAGPKHYLTLLAVEPERQGLGIGSAMLRECIVPSLREAGTLCLNTSEERNRGFYQKSGFEEIAAAERRVGGQLVRNWSYTMYLD